MAIICPTILANEQQTYSDQLERVTAFAKRVQVDIVDGVFAENRTVQPEQLYWPDNIQVDVHVMFKNPTEYIAPLIAMRPHLIIIHVESDGDTKSNLANMQNNDILAGVALLKNSQVSDYEAEIKQADHCLIFSGDLGHFGGHVDHELFSKVQEVKNIKPDIEVGWDGGINDQNIHELQAAGVDVLNVGGFIQKSDNPQAAYAILEAKLNSGN